MSRRVSIFGSSFASVTYLLDDSSIASGIAAPFALFRLKTAYTGPVVDVRRTVGATTTIVSVGLGSANYLTLDSPVTGVVTGSSTAINLGQFVNASGYANPDGLPAAQDWFYSKGYNQNNGAQVWVQATATQQPRGGTAGVMAMRNSRAEMVFDGVNDFCDFGILGGATKPANWSVIAVGAFDVATNYRAFCGVIDAFQGGSNARTWGLMGRRAGADVNRIEWSYGDGPPDTLANLRYGVTSANVITTGQQMLMEWHKQSGTINGSIYTDGTARALTVYAGAAINSGGTNYDFSLGRGGNVNNFYHGGGAQFLGVWTAYKDADRLAIKTKINAMLGTSW
jgi:hypothetical protein